MNRKEKVTPGNFGEDCLGIAVLGTLKGRL